MANPNFLVSAFILCFIQILLGRPYDPDGKRVRADFQLADPSLLCPIMLSSCCSYLNRFSLALILECQSEDLITCPELHMVLNSLSAEYSFILSSDDIFQN